ncbi:MAG: C39 family peptidase [Peptostreptococcaceae bacterium]|nr:C39 family peptidase [Peptostreptococcaceae bacterium]
MGSSIVHFTKLLLTFVSSFAVAFAGISLTLGDKLGVELDWSALADDVLATQKKVVRTASKGAAHLYTQAKTLSKVKRNDEPKTLIYTAYGSTAKKDPSETSQSPQQKKSPGEVILDGNIENFVYYSQHDARWKDHLYGSQDPIDKYGCGPTTLAMLVGNLSKKDLTPIRSADWASANGFHAPQSGSYHGIMNKGAGAFGLDSTPFKNYSPDAIRKELEKGNVFAALMKNGIFSQSSGHFILILGLDEGGKAIIADSNSIENTQKSWDIQTLTNELKYSASSGGPLWLIRL